MPWGGGGPICLLSSLVTLLIVFAVVALQNPIRAVKRLAAATGRLTTASQGGGERGSVVEEEEAELLGDDAGEELKEGGVGSYDEMTDQFLLGYLQRVFRCSNEQHARLMTEAKQWRGPPTTQELEKRTLFLDQHPYYNRHGFESAGEFELWKEQETARLISLKKHVRRDGGAASTAGVEQLGVLHFQVIEASDLTNKHLAKNKKVKTDYTSAQAMSTAVCVEIFENERRNLQSPFSPDNLIPGERDRFSSIDGRESFGEIDDVPTGDADLVWVSTWTIDTRRHVDEHGYEYAFNWTSPFDPAKRKYHFVRRRRWIRLAAPRNLAKKPEGGRVNLDVEATMLRYEAVFCHLMYRHFAFTTPIVSTLSSPVFNSEISFDLHRPKGSGAGDDDSAIVATPSGGAGKEKEQGDHRIRLEVWDKRQAGKTNRFLGQVKIEHSQVLHAENEVVHEWLPLKKGKRKQKNKNDVRGEIHVAYCFVPFDDSSLDVNQPLPLHHFLYEQLMDACMKHDSNLELARTRRSRATHRKVSQSAPNEGMAHLSVTAEFLLSEYGVRFGVGAIYRTILYLEKMAQSLDHNSMGSIAGIHKALTRLMRQTCSDVPLTIHENETFNRVVNILDRAIMDSIRGYKMRFRGDEGIKTLTACLRVLSIIADTPAFEENHEEFDSLAALVQHVVYNSSIPVFQNLAFDARNEKTIAAMVALVESIIEEVTSDAVTYARPFRQILGVDVVQVSAEAFYALAIAEIQELLSSMDPEETTAEIFQLYSKLQELHRLLKRLLGAAFKEQSKNRILASIFTPFLRSWIDTTGTRMQMWVTEALKLDKFEPVTDPPHHSCSVADTFEACSQAIQFFLGLEWPTGIEAHDPESRLSLAEVLCTEIDKAIRLYLGEVRVVMERAVEETKAAFRGTPNQFDFAANPDLSSVICVCINNVHICIRQIQEIQDQLGEYVAESGDGDEGKQGGGGDFDDFGFDDFDAEEDRFTFLDNLRSYVKSTLTALLNEFMSCMQGKMSTCIMYSWDAAAKRSADVARVAEEETEETLAREVKDFALNTNPLMAFIDNQLEYLNEYLYFDVFKVMLMEMWKYSCSQIEEILLQPIKNEKRLPLPSTIKLFLCVAEPLAEFFHGEGEGLPMSYIKREKENLDLYGMLILAPTKKLVPMFYVLADQERRAGDAASSGSAGVTCTSTHVFRVLKTRVSDQAAQEFFVTHAAGVVEPKTPDSPLQNMKSALRNF